MKFWGHTKVQMICAQLCSAYSVVYFYISCSTWGIQIRIKCFLKLYCWTRRTQLCILMYICAHSNSTHIFMVPQKWHMGAELMRILTRRETNNILFVLGYQFKLWISAWLLTYIYTLLCSLQLNCWSHGNDGWGLKTMSKKYCRSLA